MRLVTSLLLGALLPAPALAAADPPVFVSRETAPVPERYAAPLPTALDPRSGTSTERLRSQGMGRLPLHGHVSQRICRGDTEARERFLAGLRAIHPDPTPGILEAYRQLSWGNHASPCAGPGFCRWLAGRIDAEREEAVRDFLWARVAQCWPLTDPNLFERDDAPGDAVVTFYKTRARTEAVFSPRLAEVVRRRFDAQDAEGLYAALGAVERMDHPKNAALLLELHERSAPPEMDRALLYSMRNQDHPKAHALFMQMCHADKDRRLRAWREQGSSFRGHPNRFGDACRTATAARWEKALAEKPPQAKPALPANRLPGIDGTVLFLIGARPFQFAEEAALLRRIAHELSPTLDEVVFDESWPAVDAVALSRGPHPVNIWVNDDGVLVHLADRDGEPDARQAETIRDQLVPALHEPRRIDAYVEGRRLRFRFLPRGDEYDVAAAIEIMGHLLEAVGDERRLARVEKEGWLALLVASPDEIERARARGLLASAP